MKLQTLKKLWRLRHLSEEQVDALITNKDDIPLPIEGENKAVLIPEMTDADYESYRLEQSGWKKFVDRVMKR